MKKPQCINVSFKDDVIVQEMDGEAVLLNISNEHYFGLDDIGLKFWQLLQQHLNSDDVVAEILTEYDTEEAIVQTDLAKLILKLEKAGLLIIQTT